MKIKNHAEDTDPIHCCSDQISEVSGRLDDVLLKLLLVKWFLLRILNDWGQSSANLNLQIAGKGAICII